MTSSCPAYRPQLFGQFPPDHASIHEEPLVQEWDYGKYEGMLSKDIRKEAPEWSIWDDG